MKRDAYTEHHWTPAAVNVQEDAFLACLGATLDQYGDRGAAADLSHHRLERNRTADKLGRISAYALCDLRAQIGNVLKHSTTFAASHRQALRKRNCQFQ
jgi:hypothetical protein